MSKIYIKTPEGKTAREKIDEIITFTPQLKDYGNSKFIRSVLYDLLNRIEELENRCLQGKVNNE